MKWNSGNEIFQDEKGEEEGKRKRGKERAADIKDIKIKAEEGEKEGTTIAWKNERNELIED